VDASRTATFVAAVKVAVEAVHGTENKFVSITTVRAFDGAKPPFGAT
jgi:hypothetical protein